MPDNEKQQDSRLAKYAALDRAAGPVTDSAYHKALFRQPREHDNAARTKSMLKAAQELEE